MPGHKDLDDLLGFISLILFLVGGGSLVGAIISFIVAATSISFEPTGTAFVAAAVLLISFALSWGALLLSFIIEDGLRKLDK